MKCVSRFARQRMLALWIVFVCALCQAYAEEKPVSAQPPKGAAKDMVIGIDAELLMESVIERYSEYRKIEPRCSSSGILFRREIARAPLLNMAGAKELLNLQDSDENDELNRLPNYNVRIGVYKSHQDALVAADRFFSSFSSLPHKIALNDDDIEFVKWSDGNTILRDNVLVNLQIYGDGDVRKCLEEIDDSIVKGVNGVERGIDIHGPGVVINEFHERVNVLEGEEERFANVLVDRSGELKIVKGLSFYADRDRKKLNIAQEVEIDINWKESGDIYVKCTGKGYVAGELRVYVYNEECVAMDPWRRKLEINSE